MVEPVATPEFAGAVLAGGESSRLGRDKALLELAGQALVQRSVDALRRSGAQAISVIGGDERGLARLGLPVTPDGWPGSGPLGGILTAFSWSPLPVVAVLACDLPFVGPDVITSLARGIGDAAVAMAYTSAREPLCAMWRIDRCEPAMLAAFTAGERAIHRAVSELDVRDVHVDAALLLNVNTEADLSAAEAQLPGPRT
ncbi:MAG: molybdenum cofactor guanylyltransferase [Acidimicrobiia bacterium]